MTLWTNWWHIVKQLRPACTRLRTFLWMTTCLAGMTVRKEFLGVTSIVRALGLKEVCYDRILDFYHSTGLNLERLTRLWTSTIVNCPHVLKTNGRLLLVGDGLKIPKEGKKMPAVKKLHQESQSNTKPAYIFGHYCQAIAMLAGARQSVFSVPLASRIHDGIVFSNQDKRTALDKMLHLLATLDIKEPFYFIADAYYASKKMAFGLVAQCNHLVTRVKSNAVAYLPLATTSDTRRKRGRPASYGKKVKLRDYFNTCTDIQTCTSPVYGDRAVTIQFKTADLLWRPVGILVRFVWVLHPVRGKIILMSTDPALSPLDIIKLYGLRFKIELSFKQALHVLGTYAYHFWMKVLHPIRRNVGNQYLHHTSKNFRQAVIRKLAAYHNHIQLGIIAQGLLHYLALCFPKQVWASFGSWMRTEKHHALPSERVTAVALANSFPEFLSVSFSNSILPKFLAKLIDLNRTEGIRMVA